MSNGGEAADQVIRLATDGAEFMLKITGEAAKEIAAFLYAAFQDKQGKKPSAEVLRGREKLKKMLQTGKATELFRVEDVKMKEFTKEAKRYGVGFTMMRGKNKSIGGFCDIIVFQEDAPKIARILENMDIIAKQKAKMEHTEVPEIAELIIKKDPTERLMDELLEKPGQKEKNVPENPTAVRSEKNLRPNLPRMPKIQLGLLKHAPLYKNVLMKSVWI